MQIDAKEQLALVVAIRQVIATSEESKPDIEALCSQTGILDFVQSVCKHLLIEENKRPSNSDKLSITYLYGLEASWILANIASGPDEIMSDLLV